MKIAPVFARVAAMASILGFLQGALGAGSIAQAPATDATKNPCLKYAPEDWWLMGNVDLKTIMDAMMNSKDGNDGQKMAMKQYLAMAQLFTGIDIEKDVDYVTFFGAGDPDVKPAGLLVVKGTFDEQAVEDTLGKSLTKGMEKTEVNKVPMYANGTMAVCFPETGTMLMGDPELVKAAAMAPAKKPEFSPAVAHTLQRTDGKSLAWIAVKPATLLASKAVAEFRTNHADLVKKLSEPECVSVCGIPVDDGVFLSAQASLESDAAAKALHDYLADRKKAIMETEGVNTLGFSALVISQLETSGPYVRASLKLTMSAIEDLWKAKVVLKK